MAEKINDNNMSQQDKFCLSFLWVNIQQTYLKKFMQMFYFYFKSLCCINVFWVFPKTKKKKNELQIIIRY